MSFDPKIIAIRDAVGHMNQATKKSFPYMSIYTTNSRGDQYDIIYIRILNENMYFLKSEGPEYGSHKTNSILNYNQVVEVINAIYKNNTIITQIAAGEEALKHENIYYTINSNVFGKKRPTIRRKRKN